MNTLWTFGDSFTAGWGCTPEFGYYKKYYKKGDKLWVEMLAEEMELNLSNIGKNAASNDYIIDSIILNWKKIKENDFVVIGKTFTHRFDIPIKLENRWVTILDKFKLDNGYNLFNEDEFETIVNFNYYFASNPLYKERQDLRYDFLVKGLQERNIKVYIWDVLSHAKLKFNTIQMDTNNEFIDGHFSFKGHIEFYKWISNKIKNKNKII